VSAPVPEDLAPHDSINGTRIDGAYSKRVDVDGRTCEVVLQLQGRVQDARPTVRALTDPGFVTTKKGSSGSRTWVAGREKDGLLAISWRRSTPATTPLGRYVVVYATVQTNPLDAFRECTHVVDAERAAMLTIARRWALARAGS
jgi:hypothetical protein